MCWRLDLRRLFTLIELMVLLAVVALLMSILYPSLTKAREQSKRALCKSNINQLSQVFSLYAGTNNDSISIGVWNHSFQASYMFNASPNGSTLSYYSYYKEDLFGAPEIWYCPSNNSEFFEFNGPANRWPPLNGKTKTRAAFNSRAQMSGAEENPFPSLHKLENQSLLSDIISRRGLYDQHHKEGSNVLFLDGSSSWADLGLIEDLLNTMTRYHSSSSNSNFMKMYFKFDELRK